MAMTRKMLMMSAMSMMLSWTGVGAVPAMAAASLHCTVVLDAKSGEVLSRQGTCDQRFAPQSTFKFPLAVMGYDAGILKDATTPRWDYKRAWKRPEREQKSVDPTIWERDSIVWYSQEITRRLGMKRFADYARRFGYGNADVRGVKGRSDGLTEAWLMSSLKISPDEQVEFVRRFLSGALPVSDAAIEKTKAIMPVFAAGDGWQVRGKTGSGRMRTKAGTYDGDRWLGWFVGWAQKGERRVVFARLNIEDWKRDEPISYVTRDTLIADLPGLVK